MNTKAKRWSIILFVVMIILSLLNPSYEDFQKFANSKVIHRSINGLVFSIYEYRDNKYLGFAKNFIRIGQLSTTAVDSTSIVATTDTFEVKNSKQVRFTPVLESYYSYLKQAGADVPQSLDSFQRTLGRDSLAKIYYNYLIKNNFAVPSKFESFKKLIDMH